MYRLSSVSQLCLTLWPHRLQHARLPCPLPIPRVYSNSRPLSQWCHPTITSAVVPFSRLPSFPASGSFPLIPPRAARILDKMWIRAQPSSTQNHLVVSQLTQSTSHWWWLLRPNLAQPSYYLSDLLPYYSSFTALATQSALPIEPTKHSATPRPLPYSAGPFVRTTYSLHPSVLRPTFLSSQLFAHVLLTKQDLPSYPTYNVTYIQSGLLLCSIFLLVLITL